MKKAKFAMIWVLLVFFLQETGMTYQGGYESLSEYASENSESREECLYHQVTRTKTSKLVLKNHLKPKDSHSQIYPSAVAPILSVNRIILYRTLLI